MKKFKNPSDKTRTATIGLEFAPITPLSCFGLILLHAALANEKTICLKTNRGPFQYLVLYLLYIMYT